MKYLDVVLNLQKAYCNLFVGSYLIFPESHYFMLYIYIDIEP